MTTIFGENAICCDEEGGGSGSSSIQVVADIPERDALVASSGQIVFVVSDSKQYIWSGTAWVELVNGGNLITSVNTQSGTVVLDTGDIAESGNLYYTVGRFNSALAGKSTSDLSEGSNLYYTNARFDTQLGTKTTSNLSEGSNLYHTDARAKASVIQNTTPSLTTCYSSTTSEGKFAPASHTHTSSNITDFNSATDTRVNLLVDNVTPSSTKVFSSSTSDAKYAPISHTHTSSNITDFNSASDVRVNLLIDNVTPSSTKVFSSSTSDSKYAPIAHTHSSSSITDFNSASDARVNLVIDDVTPNSSKTFSSSKTEGTYSKLGHTHTTSNIVDFNSSTDARVSSQKNIANGIAGLDAGSKVPIANLPDSITNLQIDDGTPAGNRVWSSQKTNSEIKVQSVAGKVGAITLDSGDITGLNDAIDARIPAQTVSSVAGKVGTVSLVSTDITNFNTAVDALVPVDSVAGKSGVVTLVSTDVTNFDSAVDTRLLNVINDSTPSAGKTFSSTKSEATYSKLNHTHSTSDVTEGTNLYWTPARNQQLINDTTPSSTNTYSSTKSNASFSALGHTHVSSEVTDLANGVLTAVNGLKGVVNGIASLDGTGKIPTSQIPDNVFDTSGYGDMTGSPESIDISIINTYYGLTQLTAGLLNNITFVENGTADRLSTNATDVYHLILSLSATCSLQNTNVRVAIFKNNLLTNLLSNRFFTKNVETGSISISGFIQMNANDFVDIRIGQWGGSAENSILNNFSVNLSLKSVSSPRGADGTNGVDGADAINDTLISGTTVYSSTKTEGTYEKLGHTHLSSNITDLSTTTVPEGTNLYFTTTRNQGLINDSTQTATNTYSASKIETLVGGISGVSIDDITPSASTTYSSNKINSIIPVASVAGKTGIVTLVSADITDLPATVDGRLPNLIDDVTPVSNKTYSSNRIENKFAQVSHTHSTSAVSEGTNLYWTPTRNQQLINDTTPSLTSVYSSTTSESKFAPVSHTHTSSNITDLNSNIDSRITAKRGVADGIAPLNSSSKIPAIYLPASAGGSGADIDDVTPSGSTVFSSNKTEATYSKLTHTHVASDVADFNTASDARITLQKNAVNGLAPLDGSSLVPVANLPPSALNVGDITNASNLGDGSEIFKGKTGSTLNLRKIQGNGVILATQNADDILLSIVSDPTFSDLETDTMTINQTTSLNGTSNALLLNRVAGEIVPTPADGMIYYDSTANKVKARENGSWVEVSGGGALINDSTPSPSTVFSSNKTEAQYAPISHNHTASQITDFNSSADARITAQKNVVNGLAPLDGATKVPTANLPSQALNVGDITNATNTGSGGVNMFKTKTGNNLDFRQLKQGTNITLVQNADDITINSAGYDQSLNKGDNVIFNQIRTAEYKVAGDDIIPHMTSNSQNGYIASTNSVYPSPFNAFDGSVNPWVTDNGIFNPNGTYSITPPTTITTNAGTVSGQWLQLEMPTATTIEVYDILNETIWGGVSNPEAWHLCASNDGGATWTSVDDRAGITNWVPSIPKHRFACKNPILATHYRLIITKAQETAGVVYIRELDMFEFDTLENTYLRETNLQNTVRGYNRQQYFQNNVLTPSAVVSWDLDVGQVSSITLNQNTTINASNMKAGGTYLLKVQQHTTAVTLAFGSMFQFPAGTDSFVNDTANSITLFTFASDGTNLYGSTLSGFDTGLTDTGVVNMSTDYFDNVDLTSVSEPATTDWDLSVSVSATVVLNFNTDINPLNVVNGRVYYLRTIQHPTTPSTLDWSTQVKFEGAVNPGATMVANAVDVWTFLGGPGDTLWNTGFRKNLGPL